MVKAPGLPNITGSFWNLCGSIDGRNVMGTADGVFATGAKAGDKVANIQDEQIVNGNDGISFDASRSNAIYGASTTVQPPALQLIPQIRY